MHHFRRIALAGKIKNSKIFILNTPLLIEIFHFIFPNNKKKTNLNVGGDSQMDWMPWEMMRY
jgi:hypothetical protein